MSNWFNNFGFNPPVQRTTLPNSNVPATPNTPASQPTHFGGGHGVDRFERNTDLFNTPGGGVHSLVHNVSKLPVNKETIVGGGHLSSPTYEALRNPNFEFPPIEG